MSKQPNQADQKQQRDSRQAAQDPKSQPQQGTNKDQSPNRQMPNQQSPNDRSSANPDPTKGFDRDESQRRQRDNTTTDNDDEKAPRMKEGEDAPSVRRGALNTQYDGGPDDRSIDKDRTTGNEQDTLASPRGVKQP